MSEFEETLKALAYDEKHGWNTLGPYTVERILDAHNADMIARLKRLKADSESLLDWADENGDRESVESVRVSIIDAEIARIKGGE